MKVHRKTVSHGFFTSVKNDSTSSMLTLAEVADYEVGDALIYISDKTKETQYFQIREIKKTGHQEYYRGKIKISGEGLNISLGRFHKSPVIS